VRRAAILVAITSLLGCGSDSASETRKVTVLAASSLKSVLESLAEEYEADDPDVDVVLSFDSSSKLALQITEGAPADLFASADDVSMQSVVDEGLVAGDPDVIATNRLAIVVPPGNPEAITDLADLGRPGLVVALCAPSAPCGRYAASAFERAGVPVPSASQEENVTAVLTKVRLGEADVGIVYVTDVRGAGDAVTGVPIATEHAVVARYPVAVLTAGSSQADAAALKQLLLSRTGRRILADAGFGPPDG
jgi:molybdate transport system substrate-binding protein